jgi:hypothetical protein
MIRKTIFAVATVAAVTAATLVPASAKGKHHHNHRHWHGGGVFLAAPLAISCWKYYGRVRVWVCD